MNNKHHTHLFALFIGLFLSCGKANLLTYEATDSVYFLWSATSHHDFDGTFAITPKDSVSLSFAWKPADVTVLETRIPIRVTGSPSDRNRQYQVVAGEGSTAISGTHYEALPTTYMLPAGTVDDTITIRVFRHADLQQTQKWLYLKLVPTEEFAVNFQVNTQYMRPGTNTFYNPSEFRIKMDDIEGVPLGWAFFFGNYSITKLTLMASILGITIEDFNDRTKISPFYLEYTNIMTRYLNEQKAEGNTIYDEDGSEMAMAW